MSDDLPNIPTPPWKFVEVAWEDSAAPCDTWTAEADLPDAAIIVTRGWLVKETKRCVKLAASCAYWEETQRWIFGEQVSIPHKALLYGPKEIGE